MDFERKTHAKNCEVPLGWDSFHIPGPVNVRICGCEPLKQGATQMSMSVHRSPPAVLLCSDRGTALYQNSGQRSQPLAQSADRKPINRPFSSMPLLQKPAERPSSVRPTPVRTSQILPDIWPLCRLKSFLTGIEIAIKTQQVFN